MMRGGVGGLGGLSVALAVTAHIFAWSGVGAAALVTGVILSLTADDPHAYDRPRVDDGSLALRVRPAVWSLARGGGVGIEGTF